MGNEHSGTGIVLSHERVNDYMPLRQQPSFVQVIEHLGKILKNLR